jgi:spore germination protein KA
LILNGVTAVFINGCEECLLVDNRSYEKRQVGKPTAEAVVRGSQEAFVEDLRTNITLIRRIIKNKDLVTEFIQIGKTDHNVCAVMYMKNIVNTQVLKEVKRRITGLDIDFLPDDGMLGQLIEDHPFSLFPQIVSTERPDRACSFLMDGKVLYITYGTPIASAAPATLYHMFHTSEDTSLRWMYGTLIRYIRFLATVIAILLPGLYLALSLFHQEMIPTELLEVLQKSRENVPFPGLLEVLILEFMFEIIREGGIRVPGTIGQTMGMVGSIILGQAAVAAGLVSPMVIIVVALTAMSSFAIPNYSVSFGVRIIRFFFTFLGAIAGFYGISAGLCIFLGFMCSMHSFGMPFLSPIAPKTKSGSDIIDRRPIWMRKTRPDFLNTVNRNRTGGTVRKWVDQDMGGNEK